MDEMLIDLGHVEIACIDEGEGPVVLLLHGFASNYKINWVSTQWVTKLNRAGFRVIAVDHRGHGNSTKFYDPNVYEASQMAEDAWGVLDARGVKAASVMGYSMGARVSAFMAIQQAERVNSIILSGLASGLVNGVGGAMEISAALEADSIDDIDEEMPRRFRKFAEATKSDLKALAACIKVSRIKIQGSDLTHNVTMPALIATGTLDDISGQPEELQKYIPHADILHITDKDHMSAVGAKEHHNGVIDFLERHIEI